MISAVYHQPLSLFGIVKWTMGHTSLALEREEDQISVNPVSANLLDTREASFRP
jgi:hypothetical protein